MGLRSGSQSAEEEGLRIFTPVGMLGYGFSEKTYWAAMEDGVDAVILDSGSTDSGPSKLALGKPTVSRKGYERDLELLVTGCHQYKKPLLIGSAGGDGSSTGVDLMMDIIKSVISQKSLRSMKVLHIYAEINKEFVRAEHIGGRIQPCSGSVPALQMEDIDDASKIVAQMGIEPWLKAMNEAPDFDIIVGGRSYDPSPYAAFCVFNGVTDMGIAYHMGKLMECGAMCSIPKSREALAIVRNDSFDIRPLDLKSRCTVVSVAAHALYEKSRPDILVGPGGALHLDTATYEELPDQRTVRVKGARFVPEPADRYTLKLEAARVAGYHSMCFGGIRDAILISQIDDFLARAKETVQEQVCISEPFDLEFRVYGRDAVMASLEPDKGFVPQEICIVAHARASTQDDATNIIHAARVCLMHGSYPNQRATAGNFAMAFEPYSIPMGLTSDFCMYHIMTVKDPTAHFPIYTQVIEGTNTASLVTRGILPEANGDKVSDKANTSQTNGTVKGSSMDAKDPVNGSETSSLLGKTPPPGYAFLADLAKVIRSKNAGPYELTFDIMFADAETCKMVKSTNVLNQETVARLYNIQESDVVACLWWDQAFAFKATIKRGRVSGGFWETDSHGSQQHAPFMALTVPVSPEN